MTGCDRFQRAPRSRTLPTWRTDAVGAALFSHMLAVAPTENHSFAANVRAAGVFVVVGLALGLLIGPGAAAD